MTPRTVSPTRDLDLTLQSLVVGLAFIPALLCCFNPSFFFIAIWSYIACVFVQLFSLGIHSTACRSRWHRRSLLGYTTLVVLYGFFPQLLDTFEVSYTLAAKCLSIWVPLPILLFVWYYWGSVRYHRTWTLPALESSAELLDEYGPQSGFL